MLGTNVLIKIVWIAIVQIAIVGTENFLIKTVLLKLFYWNCFIETVLLKLYYWNCFIETVWNGTVWITTVHYFTVLNSSIQKTSGWNTIFYFKFWEKWLFNTVWNIRNAIIFFKTKVFKDVKLKIDRITSQNRSSEEKYNWNKK